MRRNLLLLLFCIAILNSFGQTFPSIKVIDERVTVNDISLTTETSVYSLGITGKPKTSIVVSEPLPKAGETQIELLQYYYPKLGLNFQYSKKRHSLCFLEVFLTPQKKPRFQAFEGEFRLDVFSPRRPGSLEKMKVYGQFIREAPGYMQINFFDRAVSFYFDQETKTIERVVIPVISSFELETL